MKLFHLSTLTPLSISHSLYCPLGLSQTSVANFGPRPYQPTHAHYPDIFQGFPSYSSKYGNVFWPRWPI
ncbi:uncharacterized protein LOC26535785 [Drosophila yakuba]|uniref:Uncharacterized protein n=1 Tax=Drosophila yakuba TaxID=7245 RepID=A0A0R1DPA4_DROYA|nr:uncharacterized protein LOC26535785 [Drosophila yakuba]KRJ99119.1 uncharacterized protein Dyak_GE28604 [Drosophila yakuba]